ncbi:MAG: hypothetical protein U0L18_04780 [Acutalibacteraceae bacterium]|nr:hypothetical protein [Acutalibacteraceae bacterium]
MARYDFQNSLLIHEERKSLTNAISECKQYAKNYINSISKFMDKKTEEIINKKDLSEDELFELININDIEYIFAKFMTKEDYEKNSISYWQEYYFKNREPLNTLQQVNSNPENEDTSYISFLQKIAYQHTPKLLKEE